MRSFSQLGRCVGVLGLVLFVGTPARTFGATPAQRCAGAKAKAFGTAVLATAQCQAKARQKGVAVDTACLQKADAKLRKRFAKAERKGACRGGGRDDQRLRSLGRRGGDRRRGLCRA